MPSLLEQRAADLAWSVWGELGVPSVVRNHTQGVVDPEPLIIASPTLARVDARLRDEIWRWCAAHGDRVSASRLKGLLRRAPPEARAAYGALAATLAETTAVRWPAPSGAIPWVRTPEPRPPALHLSRPSLVALRARALVGVGARADVLTALLGQPERWVRASDLDHLGYSKRNVARVLADLAEAGAVHQRGERNAVVFRVAKRESWERLLAIDDVRSVRWDLVLGLVLTLLAVERLTGEPSAVQRVEGTKMRARLVVLTADLDVAGLPRVEGGESPLAGIAAWGEDWVAGLAAGLRQ